jgi:hypothetical protein
MSTSGDHKHGQAHTNNRFPESRRHGRSWDVPPTRRWLRSPSRWPEQLQTQSPTALTATKSRESRNNIVGRDAEGMVAQLTQTCTTTVSRKGQSSVDDTVKVAALTPVDALHVRIMYACINTYQYPRACA